MSEVPPVREHDGNIVLACRIDNLVVTNRSARFDNREDRTSFLRADPSEWPADRVADIQRHLSEALAVLQRD